MTENLLKRFLKYVRIDTQSDEASTASPSTPKQMDFARLLRGEATFERIYCDNDFLGHNMILFNLLIHSDIMVPAFSEAWNLWFPRLEPSVSPTGTVGSTQWKHGFPALDTGWNLGETLLFPRIRAQMYGFSLNNRIFAHYD